MYKTKYVHFVIGFETENLIYKIINIYFKAV